MGTIINSFIQLKAKINPDDKLKIIYHKDPEHQDKHLLVTKVVRTKGFYAVVVASGEEKLENAQLTDFGEFYEWGLSKSWFFVGDGTCAKYDIEDGSQLTLQYKFKVVNTGSSTVSGARGSVVADKVHSIANSIPPRNSHSFINYDDRVSISDLYQQGCPVTQIAGILGFNRATIYREVQRGNTGKIDANGRKGYCPDIAQKDVEDNLLKRYKQT